MLDGHRLTEGETTRSGLCPIVADQGAGKSMLTGLLAYQGVRLGKQVVVLDPSGPLARDISGIGPESFEDFSSP